MEMQTDSKPPAMDDLDSLTNFDNMDELDGVDGMDGMDDLFLDPGPSITISAAPPVKGLAQRLEDLQMSGCCQKVAWSKMGCIAYITPDRLGVKCQAFSPTFPSEPIVLATSNVHESIEIVHISWDRVGSNLAIVDSLGRVSIFKTIICLNVMSMSGKYIPDPSDAFSTVVGLDWTVPQARTETKICHSASRTDDSWSYVLFSDTSRGPSHPIVSSHSAFLVTRGGVLRLLFAIVYNQDPENSFSEVSTPLMTNISADTLLTHASFALAQDDSVLLATYDVSQTVRIYRVTIEWNYPFVPPQRPPPTFKLMPTLKAVRLLVVQGCAPRNPLDDAVGPRLSHFLFLPALEDSISNQSYKNEIFAVFNTNDGMSQIWRWELHENREGLQACFQQLAPKKHKMPSTALATTYNLTRQKDVDIPSALVSIVPLRLNTVLALFRSDGTILFRDRHTMDPITANLETGPIHSLTAAGFSFPQGQPCLAGALSPNACIAVTSGHSDKENNEIALKYVEEQPGYGNAALQAFALTFATTCLQNHSNDDLLEIVRQKHQKSPIDMSNALAHMYMAVRAESAASADHRALMGNQFLFRVLGMQLALGTLDEESNRSSDVAWMLLNIRWCVMALHVAWETAKRDNYRPDLPASLFGVVNWAIDTLIYIVDDLIHLSGKVKSPEAFQEHVTSSKSLAVRLVLSTISRIFLRSLIRYLRWVDEIYKVVAHYPARIVQGWQAIVSAVASSPVDVFKFEQMLAELDHYVKGNYETAGTSEKERLAIERTLLLSGTVPQVLMPIAERLATTTLSKLMDDMKDPGKVVFADTSWLWTSKDSSGKEKMIEVLRKVPLAGLKTLRRCTRCDSYMENLEPRNGMIIWILQMQKQCPCGNPWVVVEL